MLFHLHVPRPPLSDFVALFWTHEGPAEPHPRERLLPAATVELVVDLLGQAPDVVSGPHARPFELDTSRPRVLVGVHFKPGGVRPFLGAPAAEVRDLEVGLDSLWGASGSELRERLLAAPSSQTRFAILERWLLERARGRLDRRPAVRHALERFRTPAPPVSDVADEVGLSARRFIELFKDEVGLAPKLFCRVRRFQRAVRLVHGRTDVDWADVALDCGYFDQAHLIHEFREFSGLSPTAYLRVRSSHLNHVPLPA